MTTLADLRGRLRVELGDQAAGGYVWQDATLNRCIADAIAEYSQHVPRERSADIAVVAGTEGYSLPADCLRVANVYMVAGEVDLVQGGDSCGEGYRVWAGQLVLMPKPTAAETARVRYWAHHGVLSADGDSATVAPADEELVVVGAAARAVRQLDTEAAKRWQDGTGRTAQAAGAALWERWQAGLKVRRQGVRSRRLVAAWGPWRDATTVKESGG